MSSTLVVQKLWALIAFLGQHKSLLGVYTPVTRAPAQVRPRRGQQLIPLAVWRGRASLGPVNVIQEGEWVLALPSTHKASFDPHGTQRKGLRQWWGGFLHHPPLCASSGPEASKTVRFTQSFLIKPGNKQEKQAHAAALVQD